MHQVFVYGTLRLGEVNHDYLKHAVCVSRSASINGALFTTVQYYPALIHGEDTVTGELYQVDDETLEKIDRLEGYKKDSNGNLYDRRTVKVLTEAGETRGFTYFLNQNYHHMLKEKVNSLG